LLRGRELIYRSDVGWGRRRKRPKRRGYVRPSRAKKKNGWSLSELAQLTNIAARTIRLYLQRGVLPRPPFEGSATRYQRRQLLWLCAIRRLRESEDLTLAAIRTRLDALAAPELEAFVARGLPAGKLADALGIPALEAHAPSLPVAPLAAPAAPADSPGAARWMRIELALGLELHVRDDASPQVLELARAVRQWCARAR